MGSPEYFRAIASIPWFSKAAVEENSENEFETLSLYAWHGQFYSGFEVESLSSRVWRYLLAVNVGNITYYGLDGSI